MVKKIVIDTDPGVDDSLAIFVAKLSELGVLGLTTIFGNAVTATCTENALRLLEIAKRQDIPVAEGAHINGNFRGAATFVHGDNGQGNAELPLPTTTSLEIDAVTFKRDNRS